jgi:cell division protein FtsN
MTTLLDQTFDLQDSTEVYWSGKTVMAVFYAITLISAVFFGLGYSFGRGITITSGSSSSAATAASAAFGAPLVNAHADHPTTASTTTAVHSTFPWTPFTRHATAGSGQSSAHATPSRYMVQVGAVTQRKDALRLQAALLHHGLHAGIYPSNNGHLLHVQIGPLASMNQAQAVQRRVQASGFHATLLHR